MRYFIDEDGRVWREGELGRLGTVELYNESKGEFGPPKGEKLGTFLDARGVSAEEAARTIAEINSSQRSYTKLQAVP